MGSLATITPTIPEQGENFEILYDFDKGSIAGFIITVEVRDRDGGGGVYLTLPSYTVQSGQDTALLEQGKLRVRFFGAESLSLGYGTRYVAVKVTDGTNVYREGAKLKLTPANIDGPIDAALVGYEPPASVGDASLLEGQDGAYYTNLANGTGTLSQAKITDLVGDLAAKADASHTHTLTSLGIGSVDNTADADKPTSSATQAALNLKADASALAAKADYKVGIGSVSGSNYTLKTEDYRKRFIKFTNIATTINVFVELQVNQPVSNNGTVTLIATNGGQIYVQPAAASGVVIHGTEHKSPGDWKFIQVTHDSGEDHFVTGGVA